MLSKKKFIERYCEENDLTNDEFKKTLTVEKCHCGESDCCGWTAEFKDEEK